MVKLDATAGNRVQRKTGAGLTVPAAARTMAVFEAFAREQRELSKSEVARLLDLPESSTSDLLNTLYAQGYVTRTVGTRRYYPSGRLLAMATQIAENDPVLSFAEEAVSLMAERTGETAAFAERYNDKIKVLAVSQGRHRLRYVINVGDSFTVHGTALGKALLSQMPDDELARLLRLNPLPRLTSETKTDPRAIEEDIRDSRERGYFHARDEGTIGVSSLAVAGHVGDRPVALGIIGPTERIVDNFDELVEVVKEIGETVFRGE
ncbi:IclR family transcriptional regulator [Georgenia sp. AZ-5]|uniref:IclR family transcriptional regulator n=1 Tax=Georgenia sp. AZ-5 TaxID=3367526 RepID=UPI003754B83B